MNGVKEFIQREKIKILWIVLGIYASLSMCYLCDFFTESVKMTFSFTSFSIPVTVITIWLVRKLVMEVAAEEKKLYRRPLIYSLVLGSVFGLSLVIGYQLVAQGYTMPGVKGKLFILLVSVGIGILFASILYSFFRWLDKKKDFSTCQEFSKRTARKAFFISWGVIFASWIPAFLAYYPAIMSYDSHRQFQEAYQGYIWFNSHHPLVHTFLIRMFLLLGKTIGSYEIGMALYSLMQMVISSVIFAYACNMVGRLTKRKWAVGVTVAFFALLPIHQVLVLSVTKDILFTAFFLLLCLLMLEYNQTEGGKKKWLLLAAMLGVGILVMLFRNNAIYAFALFAVFYTIWSKKERVIILLLCVVILAGGKFGGQGIQMAMDAGSGSKVEMYSVFLHQFTRVGLYQNDNLNIEEYGIINRYVDAIYWEKDYNPHIADGIKNNVGVSTFKNWKDDIPTMLKDWITIGLRYPNDYIDAFLELTRGYWFWDDVSHAEVLGYGEDTNLGLLYTFNSSKSTVFDGVENKSLLPGLLKIYQKIVNGNEYYNWPIISVLFKPAFYCWALFVSMLVLIYMKQKRKLIVCMFPFFYLLTLLLGPVVNFRYVYPLVVMLPIFVAWIFSNCEWKVKGDKTIAEK